MKSNNTSIIILVVIIVLAALILWYLTASSNPSADISAFFKGTSPTPAQQTGTGSSAVANQTANVPTPTAAYSAGVPAQNLPAPTHASNAPEITSLSPTYGQVDTLVTIYGTNFSSVSNTILFGGSLGLHRSNGTPDNAVAVKASSDGKTLTFDVPALTPAGSLCNANNQCSAYNAQSVSPGNYSVVVTNSTGVSEPVIFTVTK